MHSFPTTLLLLVAAGLSGAGEAQSFKEAAYPARPIRFLVPYAPGGTPDIQEKHAATASIITGGTPGQCRDIIKSELEKYGKLVRAAGIKADRGG